jgi:hypothetical protein
VSSRNVFYIHATVVVLGLAVGMSESYSWLRGAQALSPLVLPLMLVNFVLPFVIPVLACKEHLSGARIVAAAALSVALSVAFVLALSPLFS